MRDRIVGAALAALLVAGSAEAGYRFTSIDGGDYDLDAWAGRPVLVVNTASLCGYTPQYTDLQALHDRYADRGLVVLAVPSDDFRQELGSEEAVKEFCDANFGLTLPMTEITHVKGQQAHPFYVWLREANGFEPRWNFNKVLLDGKGQVVATWGSSTKPTDSAIVDRIERLID